MAGEPTGGVHSSPTAMGLEIQSKLSGDGNMGNQMPPTDKQIEPHSYGRLSNVQINSEQKLETTPSIGEKAEPTSSLSSPRALGSEMPLAGVISKQTTPFIPPLPADSASTGLTKNPSLTSL